MYTVTKSAFTFYTHFGILKTRGDQNLFNKEMEIEMDLLVFKCIHNQAHQKVLKWGKGEKMKHLYCKFALKNAISFQNNGFH